MATWLKCQSTRAQQLGAAVGGAEVTACRNPVESLSTNRHDYSEPLEILEMLSDSGVDLLKVIVLELKNVLKNL